MKGKKNKNISKKVIKSVIPLTKSLGDLMKDEDGFVSKQNILKIGLTTVAALGIVGSLSTRGESHTNVLSSAAGETCHINDTY